jgi:hypothetical protein
MDKQGTVLYVLLLKITVQVVPLRIFTSISKTNHLSWKYFQLFSAKQVNEDFKILLQKKDK